MTAWKREVQYAVDSVQRFERLAHEPWSVMLDSGWPRARGGRYDVLAVRPRVTLTTRGPLTEIRRDGRVEHSRDDPFALLRDAMAPWRVESDPELPFPGGAIGYCAYDLARRIEPLPARAIDDVGLPEMAFGLYDAALVVDHQEQRAWLVGQGDAAEARSCLEPALERAASAVPVAYGPSFSVLSPVQANMDREGYARAFHRIKHYIREGDCYQVNLAQRFSALAAGEPWDAYRRLRALNPAPFAAYMRIPDGAVLSSSPERFLKLRQGVVETRPIKGTRPRASEHAEDQALAEQLRGSPKDQAENLMIVDLLRNDIGRVCETGSVQVPSLFAIESYATVHHMVSTVQGQLAAGKDALDLLRACFPGGSITGAPKLRAMEIIEELEPHRRSVYCGAMGYLGFDGGMDTNIAIRTLVVSGRQMHCWAGGGIVDDSDLDAEYQESLDKAAAMIKLFAWTEAQGVGR